MFSRFFRISIVCVSVLLASVAKAVPPSLPDTSVTQFIHTFTLQNISADGRTFRSLLFSDSIDALHPLKKSINGLERTLFEHISHAGSGKHRFYKYFFIEQKGKDIQNWEYILSEKPIKDIDLFAQSMHTDSLIIATSTQQQQPMQVIAVLADGSTFSLDHPLAPLLEKGIVSNGNLYIEWYLQSVNNTSAADRLLIGKSYVYFEKRISGQEPAL